MRHHNVADDNSNNTAMQELLPEFLQAIDYKWKKTDCPQDLAPLLKKCSKEQGDGSPFKVFQTLEIRQAEPCKVALRKANANAESNAKKLANKAAKDAVKQKQEAERLAACLEHQKAAIDGAKSATSAAGLVETSPDSSTPSKGKRSTSKAKQKTQEDQALIKNHLDKNLPGLMHEQHNAGR